MSKIIRASTILFLVTIIVKLLGFIREALLVGVYGVGMVSDVYITTMNIPSIVFDIIAAALSTTFIPLFFKIKQESENDNKSLEFTNNLLNSVIIISIIISIACYFFAKPLVRIFAIEFSGEKLSLAIEFTRVIVFSMVFIGINKILTPYLHIKGNFHIPAIISIPSNIIIIISILLGYKYNKRILIIGSLIGFMTQPILLMIFAYRYGFRYKFYINLKDKRLKEVILLALPVFVGSSLSQINTIVDKSLASTLGNGIITILNSASKLELVIHSLFIMSIVSVVYPKISKLYSEGLREEFIFSSQKYIKIMILIILPISIGIIVLSVPIVSFVFQRGKFDQNSTILTATALSFYAIGMTSNGINVMLSKVFYSLNDTKTPMLNSAISIVINIVLSLILIKYMSYKGLALATSLASIIFMIRLFISLKTKFIEFNIKPILVISIKSLTSSIIMGIFVYILSKLIANSFIGLFIIIILGALLYCVLLRLFKVNELVQILDFVNLNKIVNKFKAK